MVSTTVSTKIVVKFEDQFTDLARKSLEKYKKALEGVNRIQKEKGFEFAGEFLKDLESAKPVEFQFLSPDILNRLKEIEELLKKFEAKNPLFIYLDIIDGATEDALKIRKNLEDKFKVPITQIINIKKVISNVGSSKSPDSTGLGEGGNSSDGPKTLGDSSGIDGSSVRPGGIDTFGSLKGFSTGIDRVPRDMLAIIHKDEAVLTKTQAEERRQGNAGGMAIKNVNINLNIPDSFNPSSMSRQTFRQLAVQMQDELRRLERRRSK